MTMLKTISAALLATSLIAAPAFAAGTKNTMAPTAQTTQSTADAKTGATTSAKTTAKSSVATNTKSKAMNANARMGKHHKKHISHARFHKQHKVAALKTKTHAKIQAKAPVKTSAKVSFKQAQPASKRG
jgi:flagellar biosynthesis protein FliP